jgi:hypothetical protein
MVKNSKIRDLVLRCRVSESGFRAQRLGDRV